MDNFFIDIYINPVLLFGQVLSEEYPDLIYLFRPRGDKSGAYLFLPDGPGTHSITEIIYFILQ